MGYWVAKTRISSVNDGYHDLIHVLKTDKFSFFWKSESDLNFQTAVFETKEKAIKYGLSTPRPDGYGLAFHEVWAEDEEPKYVHATNFEDAVRKIYQARGVQNKILKQTELF